MPGEADRELGAKAMATLLGITPRRLQQLAAEEYVERGTRGRYRLGETVRGYVKSLKDSFEARSAKTGDDEMKELRKRKLRNEIERDEGLTVPTEDALAIIEDIVGTLRGEITGVPARFTRDLKERRKLEAILNDVLERSSKRLGEAGDALSAGSVYHDANAEDAA